MGIMLKQINDIKWHGMMLTELECTEHIELKWFKLFIKCRKYSITIKKLRICRFYFGILKKYAGGRQGTKIWGVPNVLATMAAPFWTPWDKHPGFTKCFGTYGCPTVWCLGRRIWRITNIMVNMHPPPLLHPTVDTTTHKKLHSFKLEGS